MVSPPSIAFNADPAQVTFSLPGREYGDRWVRFALIENEHRTRQAIRGIRRALAAAPHTVARAVGGR